MDTDRKDFLQMSDRKYFPSVISTSIIFYKQNSIQFLMNQQLSLANIIQICNFVVWIRVLDDILSGFNLINVFFSVSASARNM